jgi:hypothetical protein
MGRLVCSVVVAMSQQRIQQQNARMGEPEGRLGLGLCKWYTFFTLGTRLSPTRATATLWRNANSCKIFNMPT